MNGTYLQFYQHLPEAHSAVKQYSADLFAGRLGFELVKTYKVYPPLFGITINDDAPELSFRLFDHPRVFIFKRRGGAT